MNSRKEAIVEKKGRKTNALTESNNDIISNITERQRRRIRRMRSRRTLLESSQLLQLILLFIFSLDYSQSQELSNLTDVNMIGNENNSTTFQTETAKEDDVEEEEYLARRKQIVTVLFIVMMSFNACCVGYFIYGYFTGWKHTSVDNIDSHPNDHQAIRGIEGGGGGRGRSRDDETVAESVSSSSSIDVEGNGNERSEQ